MVFSETWLKTSILNSEILCSKYQIFRKDRVCKKGGGVLIAVDTKYTTNLIDLNDFLDIEFVGVSIELGISKLFVTCSYIPPSSSLDIYNQHLSAINLITEKMKDSDRILILGDFNMPSIRWLPMPDSEALIPLPSEMNSTQYTFDVINSLCDLNLYQINSVKNSLGKILDLAFVNITQHFDIFRIPPICTPEDIYHPTLYISMTHSYVIEESQSDSFKTVLNYKKTNFRKFNTLISSVNWASVCLCKDLEYVIDKFYDILNRFKLECVPTTRVKNSNKYPWITSELSSLKNSKNKLFRKYKKSGLTIDYTNYSVARSKYTLESRRLYNLYLDKIKNNFKSNPKSFYDFVNLKRKVSSKPSVLKYNNKEFVTGTDIAECYTDFFATTYSSTSCQIKDSYPYKLSQADQICMYVRMLC